MNDLAALSRLLENLIRFGVTSLMTRLPAAPKTQHLSKICSIWLFFKRQKPQTPGFLYENQGFVFT
ncbi:hypothetical protein ACQJ1Y_04830 [Pseudomonas kitaguniensis]